MSGRAQDSLRCRWSKCAAPGPFVDNKALFDHLVAAHRPSGGSFYCLWERCTRKSQIGGPKNGAEHLLTHTSYRPYKCEHPGCTAALPRACDLALHTATRHNSEPYVVQNDCDAGCKKGEERKGGDKQDRRQGILGTLHPRQGQADMSKSAQFVPPIAGPSKRARGEEDSTAHTKKRKKVQFRPDRDIGPGPGVGVISKTQMPRVLRKLKAQPKESEEVEIVVVAVEVNRKDEDQLDEDSDWVLN
ncbi:hypothetical protein AURDEDRAFT_166350 [Auricularia subglabra TFB-10046 SS5]|uniref:C2H2-type domain-containing protein n=1 Tax=Auricularia subglabra (strain TFB-10046 / SS5) TaxID=717982 RepID=J0WXP3_AURST|nr:hypothetical protein AURDEDRAFT_166350 [Auricularia subglabra TFB-10046 SS5]